MSFLYRSSFRQCHTSTMVLRYYYYHTFNRLPFIIRNQCHDSTRLFRSTSVVFTMLFPSCKHKRSDVHLPYYCNPTLYLPESSYIVFNVSNLSVVYVNKHQSNAFCYWQVTFARSGLVVSISKSHNQTPKCRLNVGWLPCCWTECPEQTR